MADTLRRGDEKFRGLLESAPDAIVIVDERGRISIVNSQTERLFGYERVELLGQPVEILIPSRYSGVHRQHRQGYFAEPRVRGMGAGVTLYGVRKDGSEFPVEVSLSPLETEDGRVVTAAIRDVTDRKRVERALQEKNVELEAANRTKDRFLAAMSHELRTPLNAIIGFTGTLLMRLPGPLTADQEAQLSTVQASARHLLALINDLLDLARIESGESHIELELLEPQRLIDEVVASLRPVASQKSLTINVKAPAHALMLRTDRRALSQILLNFAGNAVKFTSEGCVTLALEHRPELREVAFAVQDTGPGIRAEDTSRLFQPFAQLETTAARRHEGSGLGLHLSQKLARLLGGRIELESEFGKGSTFTLVLPEEP
jgi:PAS domain S-box-containing protein